MNLVEFTKLKKIVSEKYGVKLEDIENDFWLRHEEETIDRDFIEFSVEIEVEFGFHFNEDELDKVNTFEEIKKLIEKNLQKVLVN